MTVETHGMQFVVDASGVAKGFRDYEAAVDGIFKSLDKFEKKVAQTMSGIERAASNRAALAGFKKSLDQFSSINIDTRAAGKLSSLSAAMASFKAPSESQSLNTRKFFSSLANLPDLSKAYASIKNLAALKASMESFKAPPLSQANNVVKFAQAIDKAAPAFNNLKKISGISGIANELASVSIALRGLRVPNAGEINRIGQLGLALQHLGRVNTGETGQMLHALAGIGNFKAPTATNIRNLVTFAEALHQIKPIPQAGEIAAQMNMIANAASNASMKLAGFRGNLGGFNASYGRFNEGTRSAKVEMMGLQNAFSGTFQVGSVLRSMLGSLTVAELGREFFQATQAMNQFEAAMQVLGQSPMMSDAAWQRIRADANHFGADLSNMSESFSKFALAAEANGASVQESFKIFEGFQTVMTATHMGTEQQQSVGLAIREMMDQGFVSTQRLTRQLGLVLPGATRTLMEAWKAAGNKENFWDALKKKLVDSTWALEVLSNMYKTKFGPAVEQALQSPIQQWNILKNNIMEMMVQIGDAGAKKAFADLIKQISGYMDTDKAHSFAQAIGVGVTNAVHKLGDAIAWLHDHWATIGPIIGSTLKYMAEWEMVMAGMKIGNWMISPFFQLARVLPLLQGLGGGITGLAGPLHVAAAETTKLSGSARVAAESMIALRMNTAAAAGTMIEGAVAAEGFGAKLMTMGTTIGNKVGSGLRGLVGLIGGPYIATLGAALYAYKQLNDEQDRSIGIWNAGSNAVRDSAQAIADTNAKLFIHTKALDAANKSGIDFNDCTRASGQSGGFLDQMTAKLDKATGGLWSMASAAIEARRQVLLAMQATNQGAIAGLKTQSVSEVNKVADQQGAQGHYGEQLLTQLYAGYAHIQSLLPYGHSQSEISGRIAQIQGVQDSLTKEINSLPSVDEEMALMKKAGLGAPDTKNSRYSGTEGKGTHKKGKDPYTVLKDTENAIDTLMGQLEAKDPIGKLYQQFVANVDKEAQKLLTLGGYRQFLINVKAGSKDAAGETTALVKVLESGVGLNQKMVDGIRDRYGVAIPGVIALLKSQLQDLGQASVEAAEKTLQAQYKGIIDARKKLGDFDRLGKVDAGAEDKITPLAQQLFKNTANPKDQSDYTAWRKPMLDGTGDAMDAIKALRAAVIAAEDPNNKFHDNLKAMGDMAERLGVDLIGVQQGLAYERYEAAQSQQFGAKLLEQKKDELTIMGLSNDQAEIMKTLQSEVTTALKNYDPVSQQDIANLKARLELNQKLAQQMERNKSFFDGNGVRDYLNGIKDVGAAVNDLDKSTLQSLNDQLVSLGETGKFSFNKIFDTIRSGMIKMAADGLTKTFTTAIFGKDQVDGGTPSIFGSTIGKWMGGYKPAQTGPLGTKINPLYVSWAGDYNNMTPSTRSGSIITGRDQSVGYDPMSQQEAAKLMQTKALLGTSATTPMWVKDANNPMGTIGGNGSGIAFPNGNQYQYGADGYLSPTTGNSGGPFGGSDDLFDMTPGGGGSDMLSMLQGSKSDPTAAAGAKVANSFMTNMSSIMPMIGLTFAGAFKSPIAQTAAMFGSMLLQQAMQSMGGGAGGGGGGGGIGGMLGKLLGGVLGGGGGGGGMSPGDASYISDSLDLMGYREGGIVGRAVGATYRASASAFVNAPHYAEGTANTSGIPAMLHDNEAVIPLSRGREVPVKLTNKQSGANGQSVSVNFTVNAADADSFRQSRQQIMSDLHGAMVRSFSRNN